MPTPAEPIRLRGPPELAMRAIRAAGSNGAPEHMVYDAVGGSRAGLALLLAKLEQAGHIRRHGDRWHTR